MASEFLDNPAGRLRRLLLDLHAAHGGRGEQISAWHLWTEVLNPDGGIDDVETWTRFLAVLQLPGRIRTAVEGLGLDEDEQEHLLEHLDRVERGLAQATHRHPALHNFAQFAPAGDIPNSAAVQSLQTCSRALHRLAGEAMASEEDLRRISQVVAELMEEVLGSELDSDLKGLLLTHLRAVQEAVQNARVSGQRPIEEATDALVGALRRRPSLLTRLAGAAGWLPRVKETVDTVNTVLGMEEQARELTHRVLELTG
ncbi:hypothetical protein ACFV4P_34460 [Kitasatospora sp. NPDC059795]|uniref:hypothetical protein n=1 Tax=Kitasatospora sp. NPDC059795 TaxID=3346949 RepID=UPI00364E1268